MFVDLDPLKEIDTIMKFVQKSYYHENQCNLKYSKEIIQWLLEGDAISFALKLNDQLIGYICGKTVWLKNGEEKYRCCYATLLCIEPKKRSNRYAKLLTDELIQRCQKLNILKGSICTGTTVPKEPVLKTVYYNKFLTEPVKKSVSLKLAEAKDFPKMFSLFQKNINEYQLSHYFPELEDFYSFYQNRTNAVRTYVSPNNDWISFYLIDYYDANYDIKTCSLLRLESNIAKKSDLLLSALELMREDGFLLFNTPNILNIKECLDLLETDNLPLNFYSWDKELKIDPCQWGFILP